MGKPARPIDRFRRRRRRRNKKKFSEPVDFEISLSEQRRSPIPAGARRRVVHVRTDKSTVANECANVVVGENIMRYARANAINGRVLALVTREKCLLRESR